MNMNSSSGTTPKFVSSSGWMILGVVGLILFLVLCKMSFENLNVHQIMCIQAPFSGKLSWYTSAGMKWQGFGRVTKYDKRSMYKFEIPVRFMDGGHATMHGSVQFEMPLDKDHLNDIQAKFGNEDAVRTSLIQTVVNKSVYMTGPMMSSKESYAEKRNYLISYVEDQIQNGIFKTLSRDTVIKDNFSGAEKTITIVDIVRKDGVPCRQEESALSRFGIKAFNFAIENMPYDATVESQIQQQQKITMDIQTAIADAKKAEQNVITVEANGKASAAKAKWEQEVIKAQQVTEAQQKLAVATLAAQAAEQTKKEQILLGEGEAERKKLVMAANGALEPKLDAYVKIHQAWAEAFSKFGGSVVPQFQMGAGAGGATGNAATEFMSLMSAYAAKGLSLDMTQKAK
jgi:SPFH domain / Band 7 family